jgi:hypothetical protein
MEISALVLRLIVIMLPGIVCALLVEKLTIHKPQNEFRFVMNVLLFGFLSYVCLGIMSGLASWAIGLTPWSPVRAKLGFWDSLLDERAPISFLEIGLSVLVAVPLAYAISAFSFRRLASRLGVWLRVTNKFGDEPLFYAELATLKEGTLLSVWHGRNALVYEGTLRSLSKDSGFNEITLQDVIAYKAADMKSEYRLPMCYIACDEKSLVIEVIPREGTKPLSNLIAKEYPPTT